MSKISELSDGGSLTSTDYLIAVRSGGNVKVRMDQINVDQVDLGDNEFIRLGNSQDLTMVHTSTQSIINQAGIGDLLIQKAGTTKASITANGLEFPDNSKAIFGAGSDLQIYHDGSDSYIKEDGTGNLIIAADDFRVTNVAVSEVMIAADTDGSVSLYHNGSAKLATSASGISVTGSVTADGLTVDTDTLVVDAANNRVGIGTSSPATELHVASPSDSNSQIRINGSTSTVYSRLYSDNNGVLAISTDVGNQVAGSYMMFEVKGSEAMRIDASGNLGIGVTPAAGVRLDVRSNAAATIGDFRNASATGFGLYVAAGDTASQYAFRAADYQNNGLFSVMGDGNVGIGTNSPTDYGATANTLEVKGASGSGIGALQLQGADSVVKALLYAGGSTEFVINTQSNHNMGFNTNNTRAMTIDTSGRVAIGVVPSTIWSSSYDALQIGLGGSVYAHGGAGSNMQMAANSVYEGTAPNYYDKYLTSSTASKYVQDSGLHIWSTAASGTAGDAITWSEAMRISSGNLLVGQTTASSNTVGTSLRSDGRNFYCADGNYSAHFNRKTSYGAIVHFAKDDTICGNIGVYDSDQSGGGGELVVASGNTGLKFDDQTNYIRPSNAAGALRDNIIDLGEPDSRFKDLYLSGNAYADNFIGTNDADTFIAMTGSNIMRFYAGNSERMRIDASGRVGIGGVPNTNWRNDLASQEVLMLGTEATLFADGGVTTELFNNAYINNTDTVFNISTRGASRYQQYQGAHKWFTAASATAGTDINTELGTTPKMILDASGNLLVGRASGFVFSTNTTDGVVIQPSRIDVSAATVCRISQIRDATGVYDRFYNGSSIVGSITGTASATAYNTSSDYRLKENVVAMSGATERLKQLKPSRFNFIADADTTVDGFLAHEVQDIVPEAITGTKDAVDAEGNPDYQGIDQSKLVPLLVATIQELEARIAALES